MVESLMEIYRPRKYLFLYFILFTPFLLIFSLAFFSQSFLDLFFYFGGVGVLLLLCFLEFSRPLLVVREERFFVYYRYRYHPISFPVQSIEKVSMRSSRISILTNTKGRFTLRLSHRNRKTLEDFLDNEEIPIEKIGLL